MAITLVAATDTGIGANGGTTAAIATTGATLLVVSVAWYAGLGGSPTVSDSNSNTWVPRSAVGTGGAWQQVFYVLAPTVGAGHTVTVSGSNFYPAILVQAYAGVASYESESFNTGTSSPVASGSVTPSVNGALILTGRCADGAATDALSPGGFTITTRAFSGGVNMQGSVGAYVQPTAAAINPTWSWTGGAPAGNAVVTAVFLPAAAAAVERVEPFLVMPV